MARGTIEKEKLRHIHEHAVETEDERSIRNAHVQMKYKRKAKVDGGNLVLASRIKKVMASKAPVTSAFGNTGIGGEPQIPQLSAEEAEKVREALSGLDGHVLLAMMTGQFDFYGCIREVLDEKLKADPESESEEKTEDEYADFGMSSDEASRGASGDHDGYDPEADLAPSDDDEPKTEDEEPESDDDDLNDNEKR